MEFTALWVPQSQDVGDNRTLTTLSRQKSHEDMRNPVPPSTIGAIMEYGATIPMPNGNTIIIPPRPFLHPTMEQHKKITVDRYLAVLKKTLNSL